MLKFKPKPEFIATMDLKDQTPTGLIQSKIWKTLDLFHSEGVRVGDYYVALLFLSLAKHNFYDVTEVQTGKEFYGAIEKRLREIKTEETSKFLLIIPQFEEPIKILSKRGLNQLISDSNELISNTKPEDFSDIFDHLLYTIAKGQGRHGGEIIQPEELTRFLISLADLPKSAKVFNPFAGLASFGVFLKEGQEYFGQELNEKTWAIGQLRLLAYNREAFSHFARQDSTKNWPKPEGQFDLIISHPPFLLKGWDENSYIASDKFLFEQDINSLNNSGKLIAILPEYLPGRGELGGRRKNSPIVLLRKKLVDMDIIDTIISLPKSYFTNTAIPSFIILINREKKHPKKIRFINGNEFVIAVSQKEKVLNDNKLIEVLNGPFEESDNVRIVSSDIVEANNYNLNFARYFQKEIVPSNGEQLVRLKNILEFDRGQRGNFPNQGKLIRIRDLKNDKLDFQLNTSEIEDVELGRPDVHQLSQSCLLLAIRWRTLKPTFFVYDGTPVYRSGDVLSYKINESIVDYRYLINELHSDYVQEQLESYRTGSTIPFISRYNLEEVVIKLPTLDEQRAKVKGILELSDKIRFLELEKSELVHGVTSKVFESVSSIKHSLGKPLLNIGSSLRNIEKALSKLDANWERFKLNERYDLTIKDSFDSVYSNLELIHSMLRNNESVLEVSNYELTEIDFLPFIKGYVNRIKSAEKSNVNTQLDIHPDIKIQLENMVLIQANSELLEIALNAIVENANMHAFTDYSKKYKLEFRVSLYVAPNVRKKTNETIGRYDTYIKVEVANNGKPFPKNYSLEKLVRKNSFAGETGNTGQGGFDLNEIVKYHNNGISTLELITDDFTSDFTTTYSFLIPFNR